MTTQRARRLARRPLENVCKSLKHDLIERLSDEEIVFLAKEAIRQEKISLSMQFLSLTNNANAGNEVIANHIKNMKESLRALHLSIEVTLLSESRRKQRSLIKFLKSKAYKTSDLSVVEMIDKYWPSTKELL